MSLSTAPVRLALAACLATLLGLGACGDSRPPTRIVLISLDTLRADSLAHMPMLAARAARGRTFSRHYAATSCTQPTHATLFTGLAPWQHGVSRNGMALGDGRETLAERLRGEGWSTSAVVASFPLAGVFGFGQGFEHYRDSFSQRMPFRKWDGLEIGDEEFYSLGDAIAEEALEALDAARGERQFFFFHLFDAHAPYGDTLGEEPWSPGRVLAEMRRGLDAESAVRAARAAYERDVATMDLALERVLARLDRDAQHFETHVVIFSDHGESFGEHGVLSHGSRITEEQIRVPLIVLSPRVAPGTIDVPVGTVDVTATVIGLAGSSGFPGGGRDLTAGSIPPASVFGMRRTFAEPYPDARTDGVVDTITGHNFYVVDGERMLTGDGRTVRERDVPGTELTDPQAEKVQRLFASFGAELDASVAEELTDPETLRKLRELGYVR